MFRNGNTIDKYTLEAMNNIIEYMYDDEAKNWEESECPKDHIFSDIRLVAGYLGKVSNQ